MGNQTASAEYTIASASNANATGQKLSEKMQEFLANVCKRHSGRYTPPPQACLKSFGECCKSPLRFIYL